MGGRKRITVGSVARSREEMVPEGEYELVRELLEEERRQPIIQAIGLRNAAGRADDEGVCPTASSAGR